LSKIDDVAKLARVSKGTVSNVFSRKRPISEAVRKRVLEASEKLKYIPNHIARSLVTKQTMAIGLNIPFAKNIFFNSFQNLLINGVVSEAASKNYRILIDTISQEEVDLPYLSSFPIDGAIIIDPKNEDDRIALLHQVQMPFVVIGKPFNSNVKDIAYVDNNNEQIGYDICKYLITKGHEHIMFLNAPEAMTVSLDRKKGYEDALSDHQIESQEYYHHFKKDLKTNASDFGYETTLKILGDQTKLVTSIIADEDKVAMGVLRALSVLNLNVPEDVSVIVISGDPTTAHQTDPPLTTMDLRASLLGSSAVNILLNKLGIIEGAYQLNTIIDAEIIERGSCILRNRQESSGSSYQYKGEANGSI
jgi:DNA-binding LacI/PurR family transcriptional regulator